ncbi:adenylyltransferase/cytidyltransferase family protein, partial [uncultured Trichococcus sp.]|uniref:adenylyltransferase/cytidyltransferase family protein n=1 Tax=uncultured Trichococcus sp. TaxID=189665 RepID=UPI00259A012A
MEIIHIHHPYDQKQIPDEQIVLALGYFDGVHRGHQEVIKRAKEIAENKNLKLAVMSFNHHPSIVFQKMNPETLQYLST